MLHNLCDALPHCFLEKAAAAAYKGKARQGRATKDAVCLSNAGKKMAGGRAGGGREVLVKAERYVLE